MGHFIAKMGHPFAGMGHSFAGMGHHSFPTSVILQRKSIKIKNMKLWIYIYEDENGDLKIGILAKDHILMSGLLQKENVVYLRPFEIPFDAIAHKHLLDTLSRKSVLDWIEKHKEETKIWLKTLTK